MRLVLHDQARVGWRRQGQHAGRYHNAMRARYLRAQQRHPGGLEQAIREPVVHDDADLRDTGD